MTAKAAKSWKKPSGVALHASATYHDSCSGIRELGIFREPRTLLGAVESLELKPLPGNDMCRGFGGTFCVKYPGDLQRDWRAPFGLRRAYFAPSFKDKDSRYGRRVWSFLRRSRRDCEAKKSKRRIISTLKSRPMFQSTLFPQ